MPKKKSSKKVAPPRNLKLRLAIFTVVVVSVGAAGAYFIRKSSAADNYRLVVGNSALGMYACKTKVNSIYGTLWRVKVKGVNYTWHSSISMGAATIRNGAYVNNIAMSVKSGQAVYGSIYGSINLGDTFKFTYTIPSPYQVVSASKSAVQIYDCAGGTI